MALKRFEHAMPATSLSLAPEYTIKPGLLPVFVGGGGPRLVDICLTETGFWGIIHMYYGK